MALTDNEVKVAAYLYALRHDEEGRELWEVPEDEDFAVYARLWERGYLDRKWAGGDLVYRATDEMVKAQAMTALLLSTTGRDN